MPASHLSRGEAFASLERREQHHRIKNDLQLLASWANMAARTAEDPREALLALSGRINLIARLHGTLVSGGGDIDFGHALRSLCLDLADLADARRRGIEVFTLADPAPLPEREARSALLIAHELILNAYKHGFRDAGGRLSVGFRTDGSARILTVADDRDTAAPDEPAARRGQGDSILDGLVRQLGGTIERRIAATAAVVRVRWAGRPWRRIEFVQGEAPVKEALLREDASCSSPDPGVGRSGQEPAPGDP